MAFTGVRDIDLIILALLSDKDLSSICRCNKYLASLCDKDSSLWSLKIRERFKRHDFSNKDISPRDWYFFWLKNIDDEYLKIFKLNLEESFIFHITRKGKVYYGSEKFITLDLALERAFRLGDEDLINYFYGSC